MVPRMVMGMVMVMGVDLGQAMVSKLVNMLAQWWDLVLSVSMLVKQKVMVLVNKLVLMLDLKWAMVLVVVSEYE